MTAPAIRIDVARTVVPEEQMARIIDALDTSRGVVLSSGVDYPGRYTRWDIGFANPPFSFEWESGVLTLTALTSHGLGLLDAFAAHYRRIDYLTELDGDDVTVRFELTRGDATPDFEEERTRRPSLFSVLREANSLLPDDLPHLGFYGAFGYELLHEIEDLEPRAGDEPMRTCVLYIPDEIVVVDRQRGVAERFSFTLPAVDADRAAAFVAPVEAERPVPHFDLDTDGRDHAPGEYAELVASLKVRFEEGDLFEVVPSQVFRRQLARTPSAVFRTLLRVNPSPYAGLLNLGKGEYIISASPEMYVRVTGRSVETCPISGTIRRGATALEDADQILALLSSEKDRSELTMCTDVDRNDKARICEADSIKIVGRRQIEMYSKVIHTVDHVVGRMREGFDALDAFATHMWAVTVTGAPKLWAVREIDQVERSPRRWYGGAFGVLFADGDLNTGLTIRTIQVRDGIAEVRAGGTLLVDSVPAEEENETEMKASALLEAIDEQPTTDAVAAPASPFAGTRVLVLDHEDSFVHTLASYFRISGCEVQTVRVPRGGLARLPELVDSYAPDVVVMSPGPGSPDDFDASATIEVLTSRGIPIFGVCLGHQAIGEFYGASLGQLGHPVHGRPREVIGTRGGFLRALPDKFMAGRYHSLYVDAATLPEALRIAGTDDDGIIMAMQHVSLPIASVQFHPESLMTLADGVGQRLIDETLAYLLGFADAAAAAGEPDASHALNAR